MLIKYYNIYDILNFALSFERKPILPGLDFPFSYFETYKKFEEPNIMLRIGKFSPSHNTGILVDHKYLIDKNYIYCIDDKWKIEIDGFESRKKIINFYGISPGIYGILAPNLLSQNQALLPMLEISLGLEGFFLAHGCGISDGDNAWIFLGRGGSLKTSIVMTSSKMNYKILGDDRILINTKNSTALSFPLFPRLTQRTIRNRDDEKLTLWDKAVFLPYLLYEYDERKDIWERGEIPVRAIINLETVECRMNDIEIHCSNSEKSIFKLINNNKAEMWGSFIRSQRVNKFPIYLNAYSHIFPNSIISNYWDMMYNKLNRLKVRVIDAKIPRNCNNKMIENFITKVRNII